MTYHHDDELRAQCQAIADNLQACIDGLAYISDDYGYVAFADSADEIPEDAEPVSPAYYAVNNALDIRITTTLDGELISVKLLMICGGPSVYIDTAEQRINGAWWGSHESVVIGKTSKDALNICDEIECEINALRN